MLSAAYCDHISNVPFTKGYYIKITGYCYHSVNVITIGLVQSDYIRRLFTVSTKNELASELSPTLMLLLRCALPFKGHRIINLHAAIQTKTFSINLCNNKNNNNINKHNNKRTLFFSQKHFSLKKLRITESKQHHFWNLFWLWNYVYYKWCYSVALSILVNITSSGNKPFRWCFVSPVVATYLLNLIEGSF